MRTTKKQQQFIINCDVEEIVSFLQEDYGMSTIEAFDTIYNSKTYEKLINVNNGLFIQSPLYIYEYLKEEINTSCYPLAELI